MGKSIKQFFEDWRKKREKSNVKRVEKDALYLYQIREYDNGLWLTYNGNLVAPMSLLVNAENSDYATKAVSLVYMLRKLYIERMTHTSE